jgi:hypothetical protein
MKQFWRDNLVPMLGLFTSLGTLLCCALPALLVTLGMGAALAGLVSNVPFLITLSEHKLWVFGVAGTLICLSAGLQWVRRHAPCPVDPIAAKTCMRLRRVSVYITGFSAIIYLIGVFFAFIAPKIFY